MKNSIHTILAKSLSRLLTPLIGILIRHGIAYGTMAEWVRKTYVDAAFVELKAQGQKPTITNVSALTGLTRKETKRLCELEEDTSNASGQRYNRAIRVISGWKEDAFFNSSDGEAALLPIDADKQSELPSFAALVKKYSGDMTTVSMLDMLKAAQCIEVENDVVRLVKEAYIPQGEGSSLEKITILGTDVGELIDTIGHNLKAPSNELRFQRKVSNTRLKSSDLEAFKKLSASESQQLLERMHHWLVEHEVEPENNNDNEESHYVALGIYFTDHPNSEDK